MVTNNVIKKYARDLNRHLTQEDILIADWMYEKINIIVIRDLQIRGYFVGMI